VQDGSALTNRRARGAATGQRRCSGDPDGSG
jgi:hypothetical protein